MNVVLKPPVKPDSHTSVPGSELIGPGWEEELPSLLGRKSLNIQCVQRQRHHGTMLGSKMSQFALPLSLVK